jgi:hypothetical protein
VATIASFSVPERYRGGHMRWYLPGVSVTVMPTPDSLTSEYVAKIVTAVEDLITAITAVTVGGGALQLVMLRNRRVEGEAKLDIASFSGVSSIPGTQRRRIRKVARH